MIKILVADDDSVLRKVLSSLLTKIGYDVEVVENGELALQALQRPNPPPIAILDWMMPGMSGPEVCKAIRQGVPKKIRTYIIILSVRREKDDIIAGLDSGADDYLTKPFYPAELQARLKVAERIIKYQNELNQYIDDLELLLRRHNLLGEILSKKTKFYKPVTSKATNVSDFASDLQRKIAVLLPAEEVDKIIISIFNDLGVNEAKVVEDNKEFKADFTACSPLVFIKESIWSDMRVDVDRQGAKNLFENLVKRTPVTDQELIDGLSEFLNIFQSRIRSGFEMLDIPVSTQLVPRGSKATELQDLTQNYMAELCRFYQFGDSLLKLSFLFLVSQPIKKEISQLKVLDTLTESLVSPDASDVVLLNEGVTLNIRYIQKLSQLSQEEARKVSIWVMEPSVLAKFFYGA
jgi:CheY-like chemotaxis protein